MKLPRGNKLFLGQVALAVLGLAISPLASAKSYRLEVAAAPVLRVGQVVAFTLPADAPQPATLRDSRGQSWALQVDPDGLARFIVPSQPANERLAFTLDKATSTASTAVNVAPVDGDLRIWIDGKDVLVYRMNRESLPRADIDPKYKRAGYLHPVFSPGGQVVTGDYPSNHVHHHGIWSAWSRAEFQGRKPNFWEMAEQTGTVEFIALDRSWTGPVHGGFVARQRMVDLSAPVRVTALEESWKVTVYNVAGLAAAVRIFDLEVTQAAASADPVLLPKFHYGGLGFRGPDPWDGKAKLKLLTSEGETQRGPATLTRLRWCYLGGAGDVPAGPGLAILSSPENFRAPQPVRVHPEMPYVCFTPTNLGEFSIAPGKPLVLRYRFVTSDQVPSQEFFDACWQAYATPASVTLTGL